MARDKDVFGFDELKKSFKNLEKKYPDQADALLMAQGKAVNKKVKSLTPVKTKKLRNSWRLKKVKLYKNGKIRVVRIQSQAPHGHLVEDGHDMYVTPRTRGKNGRFQTEARRAGKVSVKYNAVQRSVRGIRKVGRVEGKQMLKVSMQEASRRFPKESQKMLDKLIDKEGF